ncbi:cytosolic carboxypeptidase 6 isoform X5 [Canis lupus familiaris]|uniref:cytosolic carboxypeptidase 6 isoform X5 n=1 Tax=Canis lupus familiaris TaxID=9615 RepID=UPI000BAA0BCF|nr:cytosolic carboxypeptidase 6 isoform X5 [Canis lupus familiaris]XP_038414018.1 cytosolic carboxypeptidase 6 isoform X5 [Canis lupus familiaris]XP_038543644.1 cytosolic carboxypeptidase 6 isoform X5 [Canis lupus familiaris]|eukprot:XP_022283647.1 cytosolic carboxypeptidase 6 isoform X3 [Canis lupus familiaris]
MAERSQTAPEAGYDIGNDDAIGGNVSKYLVLPSGYCGQPKKGHLIFDACFESGNLGRVDQVSEFEYDLFIRPDTCNPRFRVWFNFTVENVKESQRVIFNIVNFSKTKSLYRDGMAPMVKSTSRPKWQRLPPKNVYYYRCPDHRKNYVMSFAFCFDREEDIYQFAYCYPYTYTRFQHYLDGLQKRNMDYFFREQLGQSVQQRQLDLLTITSPEDKSDLENSVMQKKIKIPKLSLNHIEEDGEVKDYGEEDLQLRHLKRPEGRKPSEVAHKSIEAVVARLEKQNGLSLGHGTCPEEVFVEASPGTEDMDSLEDAVVPRALYEELLRNYQQQQEEMRHLQQELERTRRQLVQQAKKLKEYGALVSEMKELRDLNRRLQDVLLLRLGSDNLREGAEKKVVFITGRVHPGETPSSFVCQGIIDFLISQHPIAHVLREHLVFKIAPMLNPDGVYLGNYRCSLMGFDLNRHWLDPSPWAHPTLHGVKQLIIQMYNDPKTSLEFYIDIHAHSTMMNGFMYGNIFEDEERFQRQAIFPKLLCQNAEDFSYSSTSFNRDAVKAGTGRRFLGGLLDHTSYCYTLEVSFYSYIIGGTTAAVPYTEEAYMKLGRNVARTFLDYYRLNPLVEKVAIPVPRLRKEKPPPYKYPFLRGPASNHPNGKGDKKSSVSHRDPSNSF